MQDKLVTFNKLTLKKIFDFLIHPITLFIFAVLVSYFFYCLSLKNKIPFYYISARNIVLQKNDNNLRILYKSIEYKNLYSRKLILWNEGNEYIDSENFVDTNPIKLFSTDSIIILSVNTVKTSRDELKFASEILNKNTVTFKILNNEVIEKNDGICFNILYSDNNNGKSDFKFSSRIKGIKNGFTLKELNKTKNNSNKTTIYILWILLLTVLFIRVFVLLYLKKNVVFRKKEMIFVFIFFIYTVFETLSYIYTSNLQWLN